MKFRDLETVRQIVLDATGLEISYAYDDLVFPENTVFIMQFDDANLDNVFVHFQEDCEVQARQNVIDALTKSCEKEKCSLTYKGTFVLDAQGENMNINFTPIAS